MQTISHWVRVATEKLAMVDISTARLDAEILLAHVMSVDRAWLIAHGDEELESLKVRKLESLLRRRLDREPIAYITGHKEFYGREFGVTPDVLIPRPESESLIDLLAKLHKLTDQKPAAFDLRLLDVGCGSGNLGITAKLEIPEFDVNVCDISEPALAVTRRNTRLLGADVTIVHSDLLSAFLPSSNIQHPTSNIPFTYIVANLPYVDRSWPTSPELRHEPDIALYAHDQGLSLIKTLISQACQLLTPGGYLLLEADPCQHIQVIEYGKRYGFSKAEVRDYIVVLRHRP